MRTLCAGVPFVHVLSPRPRMSRTDHLKHTRFMQAHLEFFKSRLIDSIEEKRKKATRAGDSAHADSESKAGADKRRKRPFDMIIPALPSSFALKPEELKADLEEINSTYHGASDRSHRLEHDPETCHITTSPDRRVVGCCPQQTWITIAFALLLWRMMIHALALHVRQFSIGSDRFWFSTA